MFKGIYNVYSVDLQLSAVKIIPRMSKNRAQQSYLILNRQIFCRAIGIDAVWRRPRLRLRKPGGAALMEIFGYIVSGLAFLIVKNNLAIFLFDTYFFTTVGKRTQIKKIPVVLDYL